MHTIKRTIIAGATLIDKSIQRTQQQIAIIQRRLERPSTPSFHATSPYRYFLVEAMQHERFILQRLKALQQQHRARSA